MMSTLSFTNLANICDTARFMAEKHIFMSTKNSKYQSTACFSFFFNDKHLIYGENKWATLVLRKRKDYIHSIEK